MQYVWLVGGPTPYREAVQARLEAAQLNVTDGPTAPDEPSQTIVIGYCTDDTSWRRLERLDGFLGRVAVVERIMPAHYVRGLRSGIAVVHIDTKSETIAAVAIAAGHGEAVLPMEIARQLAANAAPDDLTASHDLDPLELDLVRSIAAGETLVSIAGRYYYSERTLRRRLQSAYIKLGVHDRAGAIRAADRLGLL